MKKAVRSILTWLLVICLLVPTLPVFAAEGPVEEVTQTEEENQEQGTTPEEGTTEGSQEEPGTEDPSGTESQPTDPAPSEDPSSEAPAEGGDSSEQSTDDSSSEEPAGETPAAEDPAGDEPAGEPDPAEEEEEPQVVAPKLTAASAKAWNTIEITWEAVEGAASYRLVRNDGKEFKDLAETTYQDTEAEPGVKYTYTLYAVDAENVETKSENTVSATTALDATQWKSAASAGYNSVKLTWNKVDGATGYKVYRQKSDGSWKRIAVVDGALTYTDKSLKTGKEYAYKVRAYYTGSKKTAHAAYTEVKKVKPVPGAPKLSSVKQSGLSAKITWKAVTGATGYKIYRKEEGGKWKLINSRQASAKKSYSDLKVEVGKNYSYRVRAYVTVDKSKVYSAYSATKDVTIEKPTLELVSVTASNNVSLKVKWKKVTGAAGYYIYRKEGDKFKRIGTLTGDDWTYYRDWVDYGDKYTYTVRAFWKEDGKKVLSKYDKEGLSGKMKYTSKYKGGYKLYYDGEGDLVTEGIWKVIGKRSNYWIKINKEACCITIYASDGDGYNIPVRRCICSPGYPTPIGTFYSISRYRWHELMGPCWGQWCSGIYADFLFHSVMYKSYNNNKNLNTSAYNKLGNIASHGCVRLQAKDAKWIYDNCHVGTKITIYNSSDPGPLGKPKAPKLKGSHTWDPTDPNMHYLCEKYGCHQNLACD